MYTEKKFNLPDLKGLSPKQLEIHLKLYGGYVKFTNTLQDTLANLMKDSEKNAYALGEVKRRLGFEFDGMRMHEFYFSQMEQGATTLSGDSSLERALNAQYGGYEKWLAEFKAVGMMRGIGWTVLYYDPVVQKFHTAWVGDHEIGQLATLPIVLAMDMWEHAYMVDYAPADKKQYIDAFFENLNWNVMEERHKLIS